MRARDTGGYDQGSMGKMPDKIPGEHRWIATAAYYMRDDQVTSGMEPGEEVLLDHENRVAFMVGCWDCEESWSQVHKDPCQAGATPGPTDDVQVDVEPHFDSPQAHDVKGPLAGTGPASALPLKDAVLASGFGVQPVLTAKNEAPEDVDVRLMVSVTGKVNNVPDEVHHLYMVMPRDVGLWAAQMIHGMICLGPAADEAREAFDERMHELTDMKQ